nr:hypothetical protein Itr_chr11CG03440 [Ipomoea trifida]
MSSNAAIANASPSGEKSPEKQPTPSRRYETRQKTPSELTLGSPSGGHGGSGRPHAGIHHSKRCFLCESAADSPKKRKRAKKATGPSAPPPSPAARPDPSQETVCHLCKMVFTSKEELIIHGRTNFDVCNLVKFHNALYLKHEQLRQAADHEPALWYGPQTGPTMAGNFIPDLNFPPPPEYY